MDWMHALSVLAYVVAGAAALARGLSALTVNTADDKVAGWLEWLHNVMSKLGLSGASLADKRAVYRLKSQNSAADKLTADADK